MYVYIYILCRIYRYYIWFCGLGFACKIFSNCHKTSIASQLCIVHELPHVDSDKSNKKKETLTIYSVYPPPTQYLSQIKVYRNSLYTKNGIILVVTVTGWGVVPNNIKQQSPGWRSNPSQQLSCSSLYKQRTKPIASAKGRGWNDHRFLFFPHRSWGFNVCNKIRQTCVSKVIVFCFTPIIPESFMIVSSINVLVWLFQNVGGFGGRSYRWNVNMKNIVNLQEISNRTHWTDP